MASGHQIDQETALELVKKGGTLLLLDVPQSTLFGIDRQIFSTGPNFKGMKMLPPGPHFIYYCTSNKEGNEFSPTVGFFMSTHPSEIIVRKWHPKEERLVKVSEDEEYWYYEAVKQMQFDQQLGPYALEHYREWKQLSCYISENVISRIEPIGGEISIMHEAALFDKAPKSEMEKKLFVQLKNSKLAECSREKTEESGCYYTTIPKTVKHRNTTGEELTALNLDKTKLLENIIMRSFGSEEDLLLGELQFAFIAFMMGQSLQAFIQWKDIVSLLLSCTEAPLRTRSQLFMKFIRVIYFQLKQGFRKDQKKGSSVDKGIYMFLEDNWFSNDSFLYHLCKDFFPLVFEAKAIDEDLLLWSRELKNLLETTFGWNFSDGTMGLMCDDDDDEFAPVVVPLNEAMLFSHERPS